MHSHSHKKKGRKVEEKKETTTRFRKKEPGIEKSLVLSDCTCNALALAMAARNLACCKWVHKRWSEIISLTRFFNLISLSPPSLHSTEEECLNKDDVHMRLCARQKIPCRMHFPGKKEGRREREKNNVLTVFWNRSPHPIPAALPLPLTPVRRVSFLQWAPLDITTRLRDEMKRERTTACVKR